MMGCHLGYDDKRRGHYVFCPKERRLGTYQVLKWLENEFTCCKSASSDTPVEYHSVDDLQAGPATAAMIPKFIRKGFGNSMALTLSQSVTDSVGSEPATAAMIPKFMIWEQYGADFVPVCN